MRRVKKRLKMSKFERLLYIFVLILVLSTPFLLVFSQSTLSKENYDVEKTKQAISTQRKKNESLTMKVNELASLEKIQQVANEQGLSYNNNNIRTISEDGN